MCEMDILVTGRILSCLKHPGSDEVFRRENKEGEGEEERKKNMVKGSLVVSG